MSFAYGNKGRSHVPAIPGTELKIPGSGERVVGRNGEINASNRLDLLANLNHLVQAHMRHEIDMGADAMVTAAERRQQAEQERLVVQSSYQDRTSNQWLVIGQEIAHSVSETSDRQSFARGLLSRTDAPMGQLPKARVRMKQVTAISMVGPSQTRGQLVRDNYFHMPEVDITASVWVQEADLYTGSSEILDEKYIETQEAISTVEDRMWKRAADEAAQVEYSLTYLSGGLTLSGLGALKKTMAEYGLPPVVVPMALSFWQDILENFSVKFDPVHQYELFSTGELGEILGLKFITDGFRHPQLKVLGTDELYLVAAPEYHGCFSDRGPVTATELDGRQQGMLARGWFMSERISLAILNNRSVIKAKRT